MIRSTFSHPDQLPFKDCGGIYSNRSGIITSPSFPGQYPYNAECHYKIVQQSGTYINLNITYMDIETWPGKEAQCQIETGDYLEIKDGLSDDSPLIGRFCGNQSTSIISTSNFLSMRCDLQFSLKTYPYH